MYRNFQLLESDVKLVGYEWKCDLPKSVVCLVHGIGEHAGRYDRTGEAFKESGIAMIGMDLRGHGLSSGTRGHTSPRKSILNDIDRLIEFSQSEYPNLPLFLYGHSMGGNIVLDYRKRGKLRTVPHGYIATSPWIILQRKIPGYLYLFSEMMAMVKPDFLMSSKIPNELLGNVEIISKQANQHLMHGKISVKTALEGIEIAKALMDGKLEIPGNEPLKPLLLMQGDADKVCDPEGSRKIAQLEKDQCSYIEWKGLYHEIHNGSPTADGMDVIRAMIDWIHNFKYEIVS
ncbi:MAG TPA: lysophospholipase [Anaerovoracaceae bacterium]|nr:lysophospholipase [Anaerovoracaceae bacterium]